MSKTSYSFKAGAGLWSLMLVMTMTLFVSYQTSAQCTLVCNNLVNISLDEDCSTEVFPDMILEGGGCPNGILQVQAKVNGVWVPANGNFVATSANINQTLQVRVRDLVSGNNCWGNMHIEDKLAPTLECADITLSCAIENYDPAYLANDLNLETAYPYVDENCGSYTLTSVDTWFDLGCNGSINGLTDVSAYVRRVWTATDNSGNHSSCTQFIYFERRHIPDVIFPTDVTVSCEDPITDPSSTGTPYVLDFGIQFPLHPDEIYCELNVTFEDQILPVCDGTYKILRKWTVYDWCLPTNNFPPNYNPYYFTQLIKVLDDQGPEIECPEDMTVGMNPNDCQLDMDLPDVIITDACSQIASIEARWDVDGYTYTLNGTLSSFPGNNLWHPDTLGVLGIAQNLPEGNTIMRYTVTDDCGNSTTCTFRIRVQDDVPPTAVCDEFTQVSLGVDGMVLVNATTFDDGSYDNCSDVSFKVRRMDGNDCQDNNKFYDQVKFCCEDIGDTIMVVLRVYDVTVTPGEVGLSYKEDNANDCMVQVFVDDKLKPTCTSPANVTVSCENFDPSLWAYGIPFVSDNCCLDPTKVYQGQIGLTHTVSYTNFDTVCNKGTIIRTFRSWDCAGQSSQCTQRVVVNYEQDYFIKFPNDAIVTVCDGTGNFGEPIFAGKDCEQLGVSFTDEIFTVVPDACFKIERTWQIINWCTYNPNLPCIYVPNPTPNAISNHSTNLPGPTVSAPGTPAPWAPTVVKINPTDPVATNYSIYWDANANCYQYKQIIKIIDTQDPTVTCPASPVEICDLTANDPLFWNEMYWWDNLTGSHDLCEAPTDLTITATDACSGANINFRYLLFLDLDGDGTMETVVSSTNLPGWNNVNFGNANNPNFGGGTPRAFDGRPVPFNQKYGFALQTSVNGVNKTASVRWNTQLAQTNFVIPQLPYGTHKIKWFVEDGCGNESVCEYNFVVKDCKKPTVVCLNGLSVNIMQTGMITMWASDFLQYTEDNCTPSNLIKIGIVESDESTGVFPVDGAGNPVTSVTFDCNELGAQTVQLWAIDLAGNADFCETYVLVQDNMGICQPNGVSALVAGANKVDFSNNNTGVEDVNVQFTGVPPNGLPPVSMFDMSDDQGLYFFNAIPLAGNYTITPGKDNDYLNGVTTFDLVLMSKHILGLEPLNTPYKMIGADINKSGSITTYDIVELRKLVLGLYTDLPDNTSWRFVKRDFTFTDSNNPFADAIPETYSIADLQNNMMSGDFIAIKVGDMNANAIPNSLVSADDRSAGTLYFDVQDRIVKAGEQVEVRFKAAEAMQGYQFTMNLKGLEVLDVVPGDNMTNDNFAVFSDRNAVTASVDGNAGEFALRFRALKTGELSKMIAAGSQITKAEAYANNERFDLSFRFSGANGTVLAGAGFELLQNTPNPVSNETLITFNLPETSEATLTISNAEGRIVKVVKGEYAKGVHTITLNRADLQAGILFYQLETPTHSAVKKMIVIE